mgnify:CR=1 FL=1
MERPVNAFAGAWAVFVRSIGANSRLRMAPTPSGFLHVGNAANFALNWLAARWHPGARLLLRIDDLDAERKRPEYLQNIFDTLTWLDLDWDEGPRSVQDLESEWSQRFRLPLYEGLLEQLRARDALFACAKSRRELAPFHGDYPEAFRQQPCSLDDDGVAWRLRTPRSCALEAMPPDFVVRRRDGIPAYQLVSVADDVHFRITHVVRGEDLASSTRAQQYLAQCAGLEAFARVRFLHHPLLLDGQGQKLSKSAGAQALLQGQQGYLPAAQVFRLVAEWLGLDEVPETAAELLAIARRHFA